MTLSRKRYLEEESLFAQGKKKCSKCKEIKSVGEFSRKASRSHGLDRWCKECNRKLHTDYRSNPDNRNKELAVHLEWKSKNHDKLLAESRDWAAKNPGRKRQLKDRWHAAHKESENAKARERMKVWVAENRERHNMHGRNRRSRVRGAEGSHEFEQWLKIVEFTEGICPACGEPMTKPTLDHIVPIAWGGSHYIWNVQALCKKCNSIKGDRFAADYRPLPARVWAYLETYGTMEEDQLSQDELSSLIKANFGSVADAIKILPSDSEFAVLLKSEE